MSEQPSNRAIAAAIAELGEPRLLEAAAYARTCFDLVAAGIPRVELALALECEDIEQTTSLTKLRKWSREPAGCIALVGPPGCGKSFAAAIVVIERYRRGLRSCWLPAVSWDSYDRDAQRDWIAKGEASALAVVDDLGAGTTGSGGWVQRAVESEIEGLIMRRMGDGKPTIVLANGSEATIAQQLGGRLVSRMGQAGGFEFLPESSPDLRPRAKPPTINTMGRWPRWQAAVDLLELVGHDDVGSWHRLHARATDAPHEREESREHLRRVAALLELDARVVRRLAATYNGREDVLCREMSAVLKVPVDEYSLAGVGRALAAKIAAQQQLVARTAPVETKKRRIIWPTGEDALAVCRRVKPLGFEVTQSSVWGFELRHRGRLLDGMHQSADAAWLAAEAHTGGWSAPKGEAAHAG